MATSAYRSSARAAARLFSVLFFALALTACAPTRLYSGPDEATVTVRGYVASVDGIKSERHEGAHVVAPGVRMFKISHGGITDVDQYYALNVAPGGKYKIIAYRLSTISGQRIRRGWRFEEEGTDAKPQYKWCGPRPVKACEAGEKQHECVRRHCLASGWDWN